MPKSSFFVFSLQALFFLAALTLCTKVDAAAFTSFSSCSGTSKPILEVKSIDISPYPLKAGRQVTITATGTSKTPLTQGGAIRMAFRQGSLKAPARNFDFCKATVGAGGCPYTSGKASINFTVSSFTRAGTPALGQVSIKDSSGKEFACINLNNLKVSA